VGAAPQHANDEGASEHDRRESRMLPTFIDRYLTRLQMHFRAVRNVYGV
jgi:hypothetical protein